MTYYELIKLYKNGNLDDIQKEKVEKDIERQKAISEYLFDAEEIPVLFDDTDDFDKGNYEKNSHNDVSVNEEKDFIYMIRSSIRRAFIKLGISVGAILLAIILFVMFLLPKVANVFYYNPAAVVGEENGIETNRLSLDMAVYTELFLPGYYRDNVIVNENGYGSYDINILQTSSITGNFINVSGKIEQGKMNLYDANLLRLPTGNAFVSADIGVDGLYKGFGAAGDRETAIESLQNLSDDDYYVAYVTMSEVMTYNKFTQWCEKYDINPDWCAICLKNESGYYTDLSLGRFGFIYSGSCTGLYYDDEAYPYLSQFDMSLTADNESSAYDEKVMTTHFISMLKYMDKQKEFCKMVGLSDTADFSYVIENVEDNGLNIYGFTIVAQKDTLLELSNKENVYYIYTSPLR